MSIAPVQSPGATSASSASARTQVLTQPVIGDIGYVWTVVVAGSGTPSSPTVIDNYFNAWIPILNIVRPAQHMRINCFMARVTATGASFTVTMTPPVAAKMLYTIPEFNGYPLNSLPDIGPSIVNTGTSTSPVTSAMTVPSGATALTMGICINLGTAATITPTETQLFEDESITNVAANVSYATGVTAAAPTMSWTLGSSQSWVTAAVAIYTADFPTTPSHASSLPAPDLRLDARDISRANGAGLNGSYGVPLSVGAAVNFSGPIGTIAACVTVPVAAGYILSADESTHAGNGGYNLNLAGAALAGGVITDAGGGDGAFSYANFGMTSRPVVFSLTVNTANKTYSSRVNGFPAGSGSYTGNALTPGSLFLFGLVKAGVVTPSAPGFLLHELRVWSTPQTAAVIDAAATEMAWPLGNPTTKRYFQAGFDATETPSIAESDDAATFTGLRRISYTPPDGTVRDVSLYYHKANATWYGMYTQSGGSATYFDIFNFADSRLWAFHLRVDISAQIGTKPSVAPEPVTNPATGVISHIVVEEAGGTAIYCLPVTDIVAGTFGTPFALTNMSGSDPVLLYPGDPRNVMSPANYVCITSSGWKSCATINGSYAGGGATVPTGHSFEGCDPLLLDNGTLDLFVTGDVGYCITTWMGAAFSGTFVSANGLNVATGGGFDVGQGNVKDLKAIGLWPAASGGSGGVGLPAVLLAAGVIY